MARRYIYEKQLFDIAKNKLAKMPGWEEQKKFISPDTIITSKEMETIFYTLLDKTDLKYLFNGKKNDFYSHRLYYSLYTHSHTGPVSKILHVFESMFSKQLKETYNYVHPANIRCPALKLMRNAHIIVR